MYNYTGTSWDSDDSVGHDTNGVVPLRPPQEQLKKVLAKSTYEDVLFANYTQRVLIGLLLESKPLPKKMRRKAKK
jgi:hypothetical protein